MNKQWLVVCLCVFIGVGIFSFSKSVDLFWDKSSLNSEIEDSLKPKIFELEKGNIKVNNELKKVQKALVSTQNSLFVIEEENNVLRKELSSERYDLRQAKQLIEEREKELAKIATRHNELDSENKLIKVKFGAMYKEFLEMKKALSSVEALKQAIRDLKVSSKKNKRTIRVAEKKINKKARRKKKAPGQEESAESDGNRGYLLRDGKSTYVPKVRIRVLTVDE